ncbi:MAG TPA: VOC family protein [Gemmatimonadales bacterium]|nr:VOC family protein [Gemmatimonadales bacterium]
MQPAVFRTGHVGLNVSDLARAKAFYSQAFGFEVLGESGDAARSWAFLGRGSDIVLTLWRQSSGTFASDRPGLHHLSFQVDSVEQVQETERRLRKLGAKIHHGGVVPHAEGRDSGGLYFEDPDGIRLEVFTPSGVGALASAPHGAAPTCGFF